MSPAALLRDSSAICRMPAVSGRPAVHSMARRVARSPHPSLCRRTCRSERMIVQAATEAFSPPTVTATKRAFLKAYPKPVPAIYNTVVQELMVQQHFMRYNIKYQFDEVFGLGLVSAMDALLDEYTAEEQEPLFDAYIQALDEDPAEYRKAAEKLETWAKEQSTIEPAADGDEVQKMLAAIAKRAESGEFHYTKFYAIGLFRMLELTGAKDPKALESLVQAMHVPAEAVNKDLMLYKGILTKLKASKALFKDFLEREKKEAARREAEKKERAEKEAKEAEAEATATPVSSAATTEST